MNTKTKYRQFNLRTILALDHYLAARLGRAAIVVGFTNILALIAGAIYIVKFIPQQAAQLAETKMKDQMEHLIESMDAQLKAVSDRSFAAIETTAKATTTAELAINRIDQETTKLNHTVENNAIAIKSVAMEISTIEASAERLNVELAKLDSIITKINEDKATKVAVLINQLTDAKNGEVITLTKSLEDIA